MRFFFFSFCTEYARANAGKWEQAEEEHHHQHLIYSDVAFLLIQQHGFQTSTAYGWLLVEQSRSTYGVNHPSFMAAYYLYFDLSIYFFEMF